MGTAVLDHHDFDHVGQASHFTTGRSLECLFDVRLHPDADGLRLQSRHGAFLCVKRWYCASIVQISSVLHVRTCKTKQSVRPTGTKSTCKTRKGSLAPANSSHENGRRPNHRPLRPIETIDKQPCPNAARAVKLLKWFFASSRCTVAHPPNPCKLLNRD